MNADANAANALRGGNGCVDPWHAGLFVVLPMSTTRDDDGHFRLQVKPDAL
jgi:hypothetical protein